ncbi:MAG: Holliday junction resolvase RuvX [Actinomycetales bacterium]|nr:Holliday junction resolvase RuvX [Actinomycetales bacterium]
MRRGTRIGIDVGQARIGVARSDPDGLIATPLEAVPAGTDANERILAIVLQAEATEVIVGLPLRLDGTDGPAAVLARQWADALAEALARAGAVTDVRMVDERLTTVQAQRGLHAAGATTRTSRHRIDSASAVVLLQSYLDGVRSGPDSA